MEVDPSQVEGLAAVLRSQADDLSLYAGMLLNTASAALPAHLVEVEREHRRFRRVAPAPVVAVSVRLGDQLFRLQRARSGAVATAEQQHVVGGVVLSRQTVPLLDWSRRLAQALADRARQDAGAALALERLLKSEL